MATTEQFSLRWNNFHTNIARGFHELLQNADLVDVTLAVDGQYLQAHKLVLSICSPFFKQMFKLNPCKHPIVILKDVSHDNLKDILNFMYLGEVNILCEKLPSFLRTAELLQVKGLATDDSQSDTSSKHDDKDFMDDVDEEQGVFEEMVNSSFQLPHKLKRVHKSQASVTNKKSKVETKSAASLLPKENHVAEMAPLENIKSEHNFFPDDFKLHFDPGAAYGNNLPETPAQEQENTVFAVDEKGHVACPYCYKKFVNRYNLKVHIRDKHDASASNLDCYICKKTMRNKSCLRVHMYHHRKQEQALNQGKQLQAAVNNNNETTTN